MTKPTKRWRRRRIALCLMTNYDYYDYLINKSNQKVDEGEDGTVPGDDHDSGRASQCEYRWKRRIPASRSE